MAINIATKAILKILSFGGIDVDKPNISALGEHFFIPVVNQAALRLNLCIAELLAFRLAPIFIRLNQLNPHQACNIHPENAEKQRHQYGDRALHHMARRSFTHENHHPFKLFTWMNVLVSKQRWPHRRRTESLFPRGVSQLTASNSVCNAPAAPAGIRCRLIHRYCPAKKDIPKNP